GSGGGGRRTTVGALVGVVVVVVVTLVGLGESEVLHRLAQCPGHVTSSLVRTGGRPRRCASVVCDVTGARGAIRGLRCRHAGVSRRPGSRAQGRRSCLRTARSPRGGRCAAAPPGPRAGRTRTACRPRPARTAPPPSAHAAEGAR